MTATVMPLPREIAQTSSARKCSASIGHSLSRTEPARAGTAAVQREAVARITAALQRIRLCFPAPGAPRVG